MEWSSGSEEEGPPPEEEELRVGLAVGQEFERGIDAVYKVQNHALREGTSIKVVISSGKERKLICTSEGCCFFVYMYRRKRADTTLDKWRLASMELDHRNSSATVKPTKRQIVEMPTFASAVRAKPSTPAAALISQVHDRDSVFIGKQKRTVYRAREAINEVTGDMIKLSVGKIPLLLEGFARLNPGCVAFAEKDEHNRFKRAIVIVHVFAAADIARQRILGSDCAHSKCPVYSGVQMMLVGRDGNLKNITIAFALILAEYSENYSCFSRIFNVVDIMFLKYQCFAIVGVVYFLFRFKSEILYFAYYSEHRPPVRKGGSRTK